MPASALALVLVAALLHALWNLAAKRAGGDHRFAFISAALVTLLWLPVAAWVGLQQLAQWTPITWACVGVSALLHVLYFNVLLLGYRASDLTVVYPVARGAAPLLSVGLYVAIPWIYPHINHDPGTHNYLKENRDLLKGLLTAEIKGWTEVFKRPTDETVKLITKYYDKAASDDSSGLEKKFGALDPKKTGMGLEAEKQLISTADTETNGLFTITDELKQQTVDSLAAAGWKVSVDDLFDTSIIDEIYKENPDLKSYQP